VIPGMSIGNSGITIRGRFAHPSGEYMRKAVYLSGFILLIVLLGANFFVASENSQPSPPSITNLSYQEVQPILAAINDGLPEELKNHTPAELETIWPGWLTTHDQQTRARLTQGDEDTMVNFLVLGTDLPRLSLHGRQAAWFHLSFHRTTRRNRSSCLRGSMTCCVAWPLQEIMRDCSSSPSWWNTRAIILVQSLGLTPTWRSAPV
jgi:hypothetical protein